MIDRATTTSTTRGRAIFTIGHSTRPLDEFIAILHAHDVKRLVDVRAFPASRRFPHFNLASLTKELPKSGIAYSHMPALGGRRRPAADSINTGWRNEAFRGYADYMQTSAFGEAMESLVELASRERAAIMCAEAVPWRCHRSLIADALVARGWNVLDIFDAATARPHELKPFARVEGHRVTYPAAGGELLFE